MIECFGLAPVINCRIDNAVRLIDFVLALVLAECFGLAPVINCRIDNAVRLIDFVLALANIAGKLPEKSPINSV